MAEWICDCGEKAEWYFKGKYFCDKHRPKEIDEKIKIYK
jgi:hypothetical protein